MNEQMIRHLYFGQRALYYSESKNCMIVISTMNWKHAANAAEKLMRESAQWAKDAGVVTDRPNLWMATTPLFSALAGRAKLADRSALDNWAQR